jgi:hypothetical protein
MLRPWGAMTDYRMYCLDDGGKITEADWIEAKSDDEALVLVRARKLPFACEVWAGNRLVGRTTPYTPDE